MKRIIAHRQHLDLVCNSLRQGDSQGFYIEGLCRSGKTSFLQQVHETLQDSVSLSAIFINCMLEDIRDFSDLHSFLGGKTAGKTVLLVDEFHLILSKWKEPELARLRSFLLSEQAPILIGAGLPVPQAADMTSLISSLTLLVLGSISQETSYQITGELVEISATQQQMVREVYDKIGGTPYVATLTAEALLLKPGDTTTLLQAVLRQFACFHKEVLSNLSSMQRSIVLSLAQSSNGLSLPELRTSTRIEGGSLSSQLALLLTNGMVSMDKEQSRKSRYYLSSRELREWLIYNDSYPIKTHNRIRI